MAASRPSDFDGEALGLLETFGLVAAIEGADAMLKAASVRLLAQERTIPGLITSTIVGETAAVRAAVDAGRLAAERVGKVISAHVIPRPADEVWTVVGEDAAAPALPVPPAVTPPPVSTADDLDAMTVPALRRLARTYDDETFSGRVISRASKAELLQFLRMGRR